MNEVKRYDAGCDYAGEEEMVERADGDFVRHEDYAALKDSAMDYAYRWSKAQDDIKKAHMLHSMKKEEIANLKEQLTATTNSLTNAQEALKSAGIEADTVQAGVMELALMRDKMAAVARDLASAITWADDVGALSMTELKRYDLDGQCEEAISRAKLDIIDATDAYLNAVRAEGVEMFAAAVRGGHAFGDRTKDLAEDFAAQLRAGNAGKDGSHE